MDTFYLLGFIALIAAMFKIVVLYQSVTESNLSSALNLLILSYILQNCFEFLGYLTWVNNPDLSTYMVTGVFITYYAVAASAVYLVVVISQTEHGRIIAAGFSAVALFLTLAHLQGFIATGYVQQGYTITAIEGRFYPLFLIFVLSSVFVAIAILLRGSFSKVCEIRNRCRVTLQAILPICVVAFAVVLLSGMGFNASTALAMPIASTLFLWVLMVDQRGDFLKFKIKWVILARLALHARDINLKNWTSLLEEMLVEEAMRITGNNQTEAAKLLAVNKTTFHRKAGKYNKERKAYARGIMDNNLDSQKI